MSETAKRQQHGFRPGQSGNPAGRPKGARHRTTVAIEALLDGEGETIARKAIDAAKAGDMVAIRLVLDRICPPRKTRPIHIELPPIHDAGGVAKAQQEILRAAWTRALGPWTMNHEPRSCALRTTDRGQGTPKLSSYTFNFVSETIYWPHDPDQ